MMSVAETVACELCDMVGSPWHGMYAERIIFLNDKENPQGGIWTLNCDTSLPTGNYGKNMLSGGDSMLKNMLIK